MQSPLNAGRIIPVVIAVVLFMAIGISALLLFGKRGYETAKSHTPAASSTARVSAPDEAAVRQLMAQAGLAAQQSSALGHAEVRVISQSATSVRLSLTWPGTAQAEETITIQPGRHYVPTAAELDDAARTGRQTFAAKLTATPPGSKATRLTLEYFVPYSAFPAPLRERFFGSSPTTQGLEIISAAWAGDEGGLGAGVSMAGDLQEGYENIESALGKSQDHADWMSRLDALENCARNPTNPVTQNAFKQDPQYQQRTIEAIEQARSEVTQASALRFLNQETSVASGLVEGPFGAVTGSVSDWNDSTLRDIANRQLADTGKLISCEPAPPPEQQKAGDGMITYHMHRAGYLDYDEEDRINTGTFDLRPGPVAGAVTVAGSGEFKGKMSASKAGTSGECVGTSEIHGSGYGGDIQISGSPVGGGCKFNDRGKVSDLPPIDSDTAFQCQFHNVDLVNGGSYEVKADGEESEWTSCKLDLKPRQQ
jgi:hypothetical protein